MTETPTIVPNSARWIKAALIILPTGLIITTVAAMFLYFYNKKNTEQRSIRYAAGLARELNEADLRRYQDILRDTPDVAALTSFVESTIGPENMGYSVRFAKGLNVDADRVVAMDVELTGLQRPRDTVLVLSSYTARPDAGPIAATAAVGTAASLAVSHAITGSPQVRSIRFLHAANIAALGRYYVEIMRPDERITNVFVLGDLAALPDDLLLKPLRLEGMGVKVQRPSLHPAPPQLLEDCQTLKAEILSEAAKL